MPYYVLKTGMSMYDLERAYGLGLLIGKLSFEEVRIFDRGLYYELAAPSLHQLQTRGRTADILSLVANNLPAWDDTLRTTKRNNRINKKKRASQILQTCYQQLLEYHSSISQPERRSTEILGAPLELAATKGFRETVRGQRYNEGNQFSVPEEDWLFAIIGSLHLVTWRFIGENVAIIPCPDSNTGVDVSHARDIKNFLAEQKGINRVNVLSCVVHSAVRLYMELWNRKQTANPWIDSFSGFIYGSLFGTAQQSKPKTGGFFSLELFERLLEVDRGGDVLEHIDHIFGVGNSPGQEALSINLAEFLSHPNLESYSKLLRVYCRALLDENVRVRAPQENIWQEVMKYVETG